MIAQAGFQNLYRLEPGQMEMLIPQTGGNGMADTILETMREMLRVTPAARMLFSGQTLVAASAAALRLFPLASEGAQADEIFGGWAEQFRSYVPGSSLLFFITEPELHCDVTMTDCGAYTLVSLEPEREQLGIQTLQAIADRLRQPMASVMAVTPKLLPLLEESAEPLAMDWAASLNKNLYSMMRTAGNLRLYGDTSTGMALQTSRVDLAAWLESLLDRAEPLIRAAGLSLVREIEPGSCLCEIDRERMEQAVLNLLSNAIKFSKAGKEIRVCLRRKGQRAEIAVRDQGCGIPPDQMGLIFSRSEHRDPIPDPRWGVGFGLPLTRRIVQAHGGQLMLESRETGTSVFVALNLRERKDHILRTPVKTPVCENGIDSVLLELADALPDRVFDTREIDL